MTATKLNKSTVLRSGYVLIQSHWNRLIQIGLSSHGAPLESDARSHYSLNFCQFLVFFEKTIWKSTVIGSGSSIFPWLWKPTDHIDFPTFPNQIRPAAGENWPCRFLLVRLVPGRPMQRVVIRRGHDHSSFSSSSSSVMVVCRRLREDKWERWEKGREGGGAMRERSERRAPMVFVVMVVLLRASSSSAISSWENRRSEREEW